MPDSVSGHTAAHVRTHARTPRKRNSLIAQTPGTQTHAAHTNTLRHATAHMHARTHANACANIRTRMHALTNTRIRTHNSPIARDYAPSHAPRPMSRSKAADDHMRPSAHSKTSPSPSSRVTVLSSKRTIKDTQIIFCE